MNGQTVRLVPVRYLPVHTVTELFAQSEHFPYPSSQPMHTILRLLAALYMPVAWTLAYIMDDTNQTIQYSPPDRWLGVACSSCYNDTETYNPYGCNTTDNCHLKIPFIGSGITLYMTLLYTTNFTVSIDGSTPIRYLFVQPSSVLYKFTAYDQQSLQYGDHNLDLMLLDANETADSAHNSNFLFDYVMINDTTPFPGATTSSAPVHRSEKGVDTGAIVGGIAGGLTALACLCYLVIFYRRRARSTMSDLRPEIEAIIPFTPYSVKPVDAQGTLQGTSTDGPVTTAIQHPSNIIPISMSSLLPHEPPASGEPPFPAPSSAATGPVPPSLLPPASLPLHADSSLATTTLSDDQLNLLHRLAASNTPGPVLATVAQSMVRDRNHLEPVDGAPPPEYSPTAN